MENFLDLVILAIYCIFALWPLWLAIAISVLLAKVLLAKVLRTVPKKVEEEGFSLSCLYWLVLIPLAILVLIILLVVTCTGASFLFG